MEPYVISDYHGSKKDQYEIKSLKYCIKNNKSDPAYSNE